jgi:hypothetical protein
MFYVEIHNLPDPVWENSTVSYASQVCFSELLSEIFFKDIILEQQWLV